MTTMSFVFFGLMLVPLVAFLVWLIRKDQKKNYLGLVVLAIMAIVALVVIVRFDSLFLKAQSGISTKSQSPSYR